MIKHVFKRQLLAGAAAVAIVVSFPAAALAATITFGNGPVDQLQNAGPQTEAGFTYEATGLGWELEVLISNGGAALATFFNGEGAATGQRVDIALTGGGLFTFQSVDWRTVLGDNSDDVSISGFREGVLVGGLLLLGSPTAFETFAVPFGPIDLLRVEVFAASGNNALILDNFVLEPVSAPEPTAMVLFGTALLGAGVRRWRQKRG